MTEFIARNFGNQEFEIIIKTDSEEHYKATEGFARKLIDHAKPQTNADHIRGMTDEELARVMSSWCRATEDCPHCPWHVNCPSSEHDFDWIEWLQQPYKENDNG